MQRGDARRRQHDPARLQQLPRLVERKAQIGPAQLGQLTRQPQPMQPKPRIITGRQRHEQLARHTRQESLEARQRVGRIELVEVVDHQYHRLRERLELGQQPLDHRLTVEHRRCAHPLHRPALADRSRQLVDDRQPEPLRIPLAVARPTPRPPDHRGLRPRPTTATKPSSRSPRARRQERHGPGERPRACRTTRHARPVRARQVVAQRAGRSTTARAPAIPARAWTDQTPPRGCYEPFGRL